MNKIYLNRLETLRNRLEEKNLDGIYVTYLTNVRYLTGFSGSAGQALILPRGQHFLSDTRYAEQSQKQVKNFKIHMIENSYIQTLEKCNILKKGLRIGFEESKISVSEFRKLTETFPQIDWIETENIIENIAAVKDVYEIESLKKAIEITDVVFEEILPELKIGAVEKEIAAKISYLFKMNGADGDSYDPIIASGYLGALPHATPSEKRFESGDFVVMDIGAMYNGYHADMTRTVVIGKASDKHYEIYNIVLEAQLAGIDVAKAGITGRELDQVCRQIISDKGYGKEFCHTTGHGIGLEVHTYPRISKLNKKPLLENYVITIEPGIYISGWGGVRIEDDCWIHVDGCTPLNKSTKELLILN